MEILDDLNNKQQLIADYLLKNYVIKIDQVPKMVPINDIGMPAKHIVGNHVSICKIFDKFTKEHVFGEEIEKDILLFYPFGKAIVTAVVDAWIGSIGIKRGDNHWREAWRLRRVGAYTNDIDAGPLRLQTHHTEEQLYHFERGRNRELETEFVRGLAQNLIIELVDYRDVSRALNSCRTIRALEDTMRMIGFDKVELLNPQTMGRTIRWVESAESYHNRRQAYFNRRRRERDFEIVMDSVHTQRGIIISQNTEREARLRQQEHEQRLRYEQQQNDERLRYEQRQQQRFGSRYEDPRDRNIGRDYIF